jgi:uncharacterized protein (TIGR00730 family)
MSSEPSPLASVCVYCGSSDEAAPTLLADAAEFGAALAREGLRLVYGGGGVGLMGACARAAHEAGGEVLGIIPGFMIGHERPFTAIETVVVDSMHDRKMRMFDEADAFVVLPGAIGTLEESIELLSWRQLGLHAKPIVFYNPAGFWDALFTLFAQFEERRLVTSQFSDCWRAVDRVAEIIPALRSMSVVDTLATPVIGRWV